MDKNIVEAAKGLGFSPPDIQPVSDLLAMPEAKGLLNWLAGNADQALNRLQLAPPDRVLQEQGSYRAHRRILDALLKLRELTKV